MLLLVIILLPMVVAPLVYVLQDRTTAASLLAAAVSLAGAALVWQVELEAALVLRGRPLMMTLLDRHLLTLLCVLLALTFIYAWGRPQGVLFSPCALIALGLASAVLLVENLVLSVLLLEITLMVCVLLIPGESFGAQSLQASLRCLVQVMMAAPCLLLLVYLLEQRELHPESVGLLRAIRVVMVVGFGTVLAAVPFHSWLSMAAGHGPPLAAFILMLVSGTLGSSLLLSIMDQYHWLGREGVIFSILKVGGLSTALTGGVLTLCQRKPERLLGYSAIGDMGCMLVGFATLSVLGLGGVVLHLITRGISLLLVSLGLDGLRQAGDTKACGRAPFCQWAVVIGGLGLAGLPPLGGFASRWLIYRAALREEASLAYLLIVASGALMVGYLRFMMAPESAKTLEESTEGDTSTISKLIMAGLAVASLAIGLYPQSVLGSILDVVERLAALG